MAGNVIWHGPKISSWSSFQTLVKDKRRALLSHLDRYQDAILVAGCQRSGTTALARLMGSIPRMADYRFGRDDELDAALMLCGYVEQSVDGRCCFQTTYVNECCSEYFDHGDYRLIWMLREPVSVVHSMLYNWKRAALRRLYAACGAQLKQNTRQWGLGKAIGPSRLEQACASYIGKTQQTFLLAEKLDRDRLMIIDYDDVVSAKEVLLPRVFEFVGVPFENRYLDQLHASSVGKGARLASAKAAYVRDQCGPVYEKARRLCDSRSD